MPGDLTTVQNEESFYKNGENYWSEVPATVDGMLGGFGHISGTDIQGSKTLLRQIFSSNNSPGRTAALDCGAGIGRITKFLLCPFFDKVDMVEQNAAFLKQAQDYLGPHLYSEKIDKIYSTALQYFEPDFEKYDVIWIQWVLGHLTDDDFVIFLKKCRNGLKRNGVIVVKENITSSDQVDVDEKDSSVTRPLSLLKLLFIKANLECSRLQKQIHFPKGLYNVYMFVLKPKSADGNPIRNITKE
ncbi:N-terminal Xaa-Pro-Lys N-methyltransferase 1-B [Cylas formicarius]|uniref:N-terminal Xaa-Pro-Lys N-methyltransferase 1-B n=1 Tax=Cylas formicarius TaxID=197179 RepID=UPI0029586C97|nr:N-terminal Xaa-Pro-Lys N-methyltransferase 1-B [Cylas formicarius]